MMLFNLAMMLLTAFLLTAAAIIVWFIFEAIRFAWDVHKWKPEKAECCEEIDYAKFL